MTTNDNNTDAPVTTQTGVTGIYTPITPETISLSTSSWSYFTPPWSEPITKSNTLLLSDNESVIEVMLVRGEGEVNCGYDVLCSERIANLPLNVAVRVTGHVVLTSLSEDGAVVIRNI